MGTVDVFCVETDEIMLAVNTLTDGRKGGPNTSKLALGQSFFLEEVLPYSQYLRAVHCCRNDDN
jgi:hypothetical protein